MEAGRRIAWLIAEKSMRRKFIGGMASAAGAVSVGRALDSTKAGTGKIYLPDPTNEPMLVRGVGTQFEKECQVGGLLVLPSVNGTAANSEILEIHNNEEIRLKKDFKGDVAIGQLTGRREENGDVHLENGVANDPPDFQGTRYKTAPKVDQSKVYDAVFERLQAGGCVGIFPEGGSHDRTELLPLKGICELKAQLVSCKLLLISISRCCDHGPRFTSSKPRFRPQNRSLWHELLSRSQIQVKGRR